MWLTLPAATSPFRYTSSLTAMPTSHTYGEVMERRLPNGLTVLLKESRTAPVVTLAMAYRVGSCCEYPGVTGVSHLLEHAMFKGTANHRSGEFDLLMALAGADANAYTWLDKTVYHVTLPAGREVLALELEADRMRNLLFSPDEHAEELEVVRNELEQRDDSPFALLFETMQSTAFSAHPYWWPTIGLPGDLARLSVDDLARHYRRYYCPENAVLVAVGMFKPEELLREIERHFGGIASCGFVPPRLPAEPPQLSARRLLLRRAGRTDYLLMAWHTPSAGDPDAYALEICSHALGAGRTSRLYQAVVETRLASAVRATSGCFTYRFPFLLHVGAALNEGVPLGRVESAVLAEIGRVAEGGITELELARARKEAEAGFIYSGDSAEGEADLLLGFELVASHRDIPLFLPRLNAVTCKDVQRVARKYLTEANSTVAWYEGVRENEGAESERPDTLEKMGIGDPESVHVHDPAPELTPPRPVCRASRDELAAPASGAGSGDSDELEYDLYPGAIVQVVRGEHENPTVTIAGRIAVGSAFDPPGRSGLCNLAVNLLAAGTARRSKLELATVLEDNAISLGYSCGRESFAFGGRCLSADLSTLFGVLGEELGEPVFPPEQLELERARILSDIARSRDSTSERAYFAAREALYGADNPYAPPVFGWEDSVQAISREEIMRFFEEEISAASMVLVVVGDVETGQVSDLVSKHFADRLFRIRAADEAEVMANSRRVRAAGRRLSIPLPDKSNASAVVLRPGPARTAPDYHAAAVANYLFGGDITSRLNERLRTRSGLTYGAYSHLNPGRLAGLWGFSIQANPARVDEALELGLEEWRRMLDEGISDEELHRAKSYLSGNHAVELGHPSARAAALADLLYHGLDTSLLEEYPRVINALTQAQVEAAFREHCAMDGYIAITAGTPPH